MAKVKEKIKKMSHYKPPLEGRSEKNYLLLDFNERTTEPSPKVKEALKKFIDSGKLQVYPEYGDLEAKIAKYAGVPAGEIMGPMGEIKELILSVESILIQEIKLSFLFQLSLCIINQLEFKGQKF